MDLNVILAKPPSKLKMIECRALLGCNDTEWSEIGAVVRAPENATRRTIPCANSQLLEITKEHELSSISWSDQRYDSAAQEALDRSATLKSFLYARIPNKDDRYKMEVVKRMITVKAKKQTELASKRKNRSSNVNGDVKTRDAQSDNMSVDSRRSVSPVPAPAPVIQHHRPPQGTAITPLSSKFSPTAYTYEYRPSETVVPRPYQHGRMTMPLSPQSAQSQQSNPTDISDVFLAQTQRTLPRVRGANC
jgi:hypothetical protein